MPEEKRMTLVYRVLRYTPNLVRDEWVNIGVLLEEAGGSRREARLIQEPGELARVRRLHPAADEDLLRSLPVEFDARLADSPPEVEKYIDKLELTLSNVLQFSPQRGLLAEDFDAEMDRLYRDHVTPPARTRSGIVESTRAWIRERLRDVFRRHRLVRESSKKISASRSYTQPGDPLKLDYAYQNGVRGYLHSIVLGRDLAASESPRLHRRMHSRAHSRRRIHRHHGNRARARQSPPPVHGESFRRPGHRHRFAESHRAFRR